ncbi:MAG: glutathione-disulfide reductase [Alphaproteobacteria bacterium]|nr:glutathione-disulfide reductase [Alphaproteobacteria bacterium]
MPQFDYDLFVIGAGSGGVRAARMAGAAGARVAIAEDRYLGGTCVNVGCIPKKLFVYAAHFAEDFEDAVSFGWTDPDRRHDWPTLIANKNTEIARLNGIYERLLGNAGVDLFEGRAVVTGPQRVEVDGRSISAERLLIATGGWPVVPDIPGRDLAITSNEAFFLEELPPRIIIVGGGYIAVEFAGIFNGLGVETVQLYRGPHFLRGFDEDVRQTLAVEMRKKNIDLRFNSNIARIVRAGGDLCAELEDGTEIRADAIMYATGRAPNTRDLGLEAIGVGLAENGAIKVDDRFQSSVPSIYALGDVIDRLALTPVAIVEAMVLVDSLYRGGEKRMDYANIPTAVFSQPPIGTVGQTEAVARRDCPGGIDVFVSDFKPLKHTLTGRDERTLMKLVVDRASDRVVGLHMVGPEAGEIVQGFAVAMKAGATKADFDATVGIHPTSAEEFVTMREPVPDEAETAAAE